ncbi:MAG: hypothetical protein ACYTFQ_27800 [Planctomycetota bacterium]|jgi:hypothetical protein
MMVSEKKSHYFPAVVICLLVAAAGCAPSGPKTDTVTGKPPGAPTDEAVALSLKFAPEDLTTYTLITERWRSVKFEGSVTKERALRGGTSGDKIAMTFTQRVKSLDDKGNAIAEITIKELKYLAEEKDRVFLDFDSSRARDRNSPLAKLIGQSYTIELTPSGKVERVIDAGPARNRTGGVSSAHTRALALVDPDTITKRHTIPAMPGGDKNQIRIGDDWSDIKTFSFGLMGAKSYERIYALKEVKGEDGKRVAVVEMNAIPTSEKAEELYADQPTGTFSKMFDNVETYKGQLKLDLASGKVEEYFEELKSEWVVVDPVGREGGAKEPSALKMTADRLYDLRRID